MHLPPLDIDPDKINPRLLPQGMQALVRAIGLGAAIRLAEAFPGLQIYVPTRASRKHKIAKAIGLEAMELLCRHSGPKWMDVPKLDSVIQQLKHRLVIELREQNYSASRIAVALDYTERHVLRIVSEHRTERSTDCNLDLFSDDE